MDGSMQQVLRISSHPLCSIPFTPLKLVICMFTTVKTLCPTGFASPSLLWSGTQLL